MGKMTYKRRKHVKKQSFKKRKNKKMKGGDNTEDDVSASTPTGDASTPTGDASTETVPATGVPATGDVATGDAATGVPATGDASTGDASTGVPATGDVQETKVGNPQDDADYKQFLEDLKVNPDEILRKKVYLWESVEEFFIYDPHANKWKNERQTLNDDVSDTQGNTKNNPNESV